MSDGPAARAGRRAAGALVAVLAAALLVAEATMQPSPRDRALLVGIFVGVGVVTLLAATVLGRMTRRLRSIRTAVMAVAVGAVAAATLAVLASAATMFLNAHDLRLVLVALGLGVGLGSVAASTVTGHLTADLEAIGEVTRAVAEGRRDVRTDVERPDEVGALARAFDDMVERLDAAETERDRMEGARREFLAAVGHDLRTPLTSLRSAIELLRDGMADDPDRYLVAMQGDVQLLSSLVDDLFLLARIESGGLILDRERVDLAELCDEALEATGPTGHDRGVRLQLDVRGRSQAQVDPREIQRVLRNLLANAVRHSPDGGTVRVAVEGADDHVEVEVADEGPGFPAEFLTRAFDSFTRADEARTRADGGAGLGLAIARGIVEAHGGSITAQPGPGGRVTLQLPTAPA